MPELPFLPPQASTIASQVDLIFIALLGLSTIFTSIVVVLVIYFSIRYRRGNRVDRSNPPVTNLRMELSWIGGLLLLGLGTFTGASIVYFRMSDPPRDAMDVFVVGQQWMWKFQHPQGVREINTLHIPVGEQVRLVMISQDVIHSFYVPAFRLKYDVLPSRYTYLWFEATQTGEFPIYCAEFCGAHHSRMLGRVIVMDPQEYESWLSTGGAAAAPMAQDGEQLFQQLGCSGCHAAEASARAPTLAGVSGSSVTLEGGDTVIADETYLRESILLPNEKVVAGYAPIMPAYEGRISAEQLNELVAYIRSLDEGQPAPAGTREPPASETAH